MSRTIIRTPAAFISPRNLCTCCLREARFTGLDDSIPTMMGCLWSVAMWKRDPLGWIQFAHRMEVRRAPPLQHLISGGLMP